MGLFLTRDLWEGPSKLAHLPNNTTFLLRKPWKFQFISCSGSKVILFLLPDRQSYRGTFCIPICTGEIFLYGNLYLSLHYILLFALLTHSLRFWRIINLGQHFNSRIVVHCEFVLWLICTSATSSNEFIISSSCPSRIKLASLGERPSAGI